MTAPFLIVTSHAGHTSPGDVLLALAVGVFVVIVLFALFAFRRRGR